MACDMIENTGGITKRRRTLIMLGMGLGMFIACFDGTVVETCGPIIATELNGTSLYAWMTVAYMLCETVMIPIAGKLSDRHGRKPLFLIGCVIFFMGSITAGLSVSIEMFIIARALQGIGGGILIPVATAAVGDLYDEKERGRMLGIMNSLFAIGSGIGPIIGGYIADTFSWHWAFFINIPMFTACILLTVREYPKNEHVATGRMDYAGTAVLATSILLVLGLFQFAGSRFEWVSPWTVAIVVAVVVLMALFVRIERRAEDPVLPLRLVKNRTIAASMVYLFVIGLMMFGSMVYINLMGMEVLGFTATEAGVYSLALVFGMSLTSMLSGMMLERTGYVPWMIAGPLVCAAGLFAMSQITVGTEVWYYLVSTFVLGVGIGCVMSILVTAAQNSASPEDMGVATSAVSTIRSIGSTIGATVFAGIINSHLATRLAESLPDSVFDMIPHDTGVLDDSVMGMLTSMDGGNEFVDACILAVSDSIGFSFVVGGVASIIIVAFVFLFPRKHSGDRADAEE